ncbi:MAG: A/G-specific adenine glycosylase [Verrucomicrobiia bacterium]|jgi:A/G-specific adenine glycosylase
MATRFHTHAVRVNTGVRRAFHHDLPRWYRRHHRKLPWRSTRDPYRIWVSEIMLQQTRVETVRPYYARWLQAFPTIQSLARASDDRVLKLWEGLGYYSRARNLHRAAQAVVRERDGQLPHTVDGLCALPGIGRYTAGAIASIAFGERVPLVDGNVARVFARIFAIPASVKSPRTLQSLWTLAEDLLPDTDPGDFNQALMELGALVCTPAAPHCDTCPMRRVCAARARGLVEQLPNRGDKLQTVHVVAKAAFVKSGNRILLKRRPRQGLLADFWELPAADARLFRVGHRIHELRHTITHRRIVFQVYACVPITKFWSNGEWRWAARAQLKALALPAAHRRAIESVLSAQK